MKGTPDIVIILPNIRSTHNVGAIFRTAEGFGVNKIYLCGYTPYPDLTIVGKEDGRLPHIRQKLTAQIHKTALGAEKTVPFHYTEQPPLDILIRQGYQIIGLEQTPNSLLLNDFAPASKKIAVLLGEEVRGLPQALIDQCDALVEIPMKGQKESFNVAVALGICLYGLVY